VWRVTQTVLIIILLKAKSEIINQLVTYNLISDHLITLTLNKRRANAKPSYIPIQLCSIISKFTTKVLYVGCNPGIMPSDHLDKIRLTLEAKECISYRFLSVDLNTKVDVAKR